MPEWLVGFVVACRELYLSELPNPPTQRGGWGDHFDHPESLASPTPPFQKYNPCLTHRHRLPAIATSAVPLSGWRLLRMPVERNRGICPKQVIFRDFGLGGSVVIGQHDPQKLPQSPVPR